MSSAFVPSADATLTEIDMMSEKM
ncbi:hypothetical protein ID866_5431 [Astraeus odoratus]|nr:hypothetical protein ID866_5431 [Astraeus odoratus]